MAQVLLFEPVERHVFRSAVLSVVFLLAIGQNAGLLGRICCDPLAAATSCCRQAHSTQSRGVATDDNCDRAVTSVGTFLREEGERLNCSTDARQAVSVSLYQILPNSTGARAIEEPDLARSPGHRPLSTALRI